MLNCQRGRIMLLPAIKAPKSKNRHKKSPKRLFIEKTLSAALSGPKTQERRRKFHSFLFEKNKPTQSSFSHRTVFFFPSHASLSFLLWRAIISHKKLWLIPTQRIHFFLFLFLLFSWGLLMYFNKNPFEISPKFHGNWGRQKRSCRREFGEKLYGMW